MLSDIKGASNNYTFNIEVKGYSNELEQTPTTQGGTAVEVTLNESLLEKALVSVVVSNKH
jgi:hypothetical protein